MIPAAFYRPDLAETNPGVSARVVNVNPRHDSQGISYHPRKGLAPLSTALPGPPRGAIAGVTRSGLFMGYVGTASALFELQSNYAFDQIGTGYTLPAGDVWGATQYGDRMLFSNRSDGMFQFDIEGLGAVTAIAGAPKARSLFTAFECVFALDCDGNEFLMRNSAIGNYANWKSGGAGAQEFADGESLMGGGSLNDGTAAVLQRSAVHVLSVSGDAKVYNKVKIAAGIGAVSPRCIVPTPGALYFLDVGGFYRLTSAGLEPIGQDKVNARFLSRLDASSMATVEGAYDPQRRQVCWRYRAGGLGNDEVFANIMVFDIVTGEFVELEEQTSALMGMSVPALTLEDLDSFGSIEDVPYPLDSEVWKGDRPRLAAFDETYRLGFFDGQTLAADIETATLTSPRELRVNGVMPVTDAADIAMQLGVRQRLADPVAWKAAAPMQPSGRVPMSGKGRAILVRAHIPAGASWTYFRGLDGLDSQEPGGR